MSEFAPYSSEHEATEAYKELLDEIYPTVVFGDLRFDPSRIIEELDPLAFRCGFDEYMDAVQEDMEEAA